MSNTKNNPLILLKKRALYYLAKREYSHLELKLKLREYAQTLELNEEALNLFLSSLVSEGWLSNERYCEQFIHAKKNKFGRYKIIRELEEKGIDEALIEQYLKPLKNQEFLYAKQVWQKKFKFLPTSKEEWSKQARFLQSRGFDVSLIKKILNAKEE
ncbi:MAG TPA: recombination regulator RecX [Methylophilaceae bacterium]|nr:recombination regulator RecX [Methylophilaceae bacterium]